MKKFKKTVTVVYVFLLFFPVIAFAQKPAIDTTTKKIFEPVKVEKEISGISIGLFGLYGYYEMKTDDRWTLRVEAKIKVLPGWAGSFVLVLTPAISIEPKWYYYLNEDKSVLTKNSGSFIAARASFTFPVTYLFYTTKENSHRTGFYTGEYSFYVMPMWGIRKTWWEHFTLEFGVGAGFGGIIQNAQDATTGVRSTYSYLGVAVDIYLTIGYTF